MEIYLRPARADDAAATERIETAADALLVDRFGAVDWPPPTPADDRASSPGFVLVAEHSGDATAAPLVVGFVHVLDLDGHAHLEQLSVLPSFGRRGIGRQLVEGALAEAGRRGHSEITLRTYVDVPWNAPFYETCGFVTTEPQTPLLIGLVRVEEALGLFEFGARVQMTAVL
jgi:GNAT superfamily N-acetyltransferase